MLPIKQKSYIIETLVPGESGKLVVNEHMVGTFNNLQ